MGVDYNAVGGIGIQVSDELVAEAIALELFTAEDWSEDPQGCLESLDIPYEVAGDGCYGGDDRFYFTINAYKYKDVNNSKDNFLHVINSTFKTNYTDADLIVISDLHVW